MRIKQYIWGIFACFFIQSVLAEECLVSTDFRNLMSNAPELVKEKIDRQNGRYVAVLKNGDNVIAKFATCDLGLQVHYFSTKEINETNARQAIGWWLEYVLPSKDAYEQTLKQLNSMDTNDFKNAIVLEGINDQHRLVIEPSSSPLFLSSIYYEWIPPQY
ncbi:hypothetical protein [Aliikangiella sp. IMCC44359]|uniref:hypothetical protein n=1 Tax=Aliikangiella sp. IMCC44359 TaxID=3459125 RepID=UPI00403AFB7F